LLDSGRLGSQWVALPLTSLPAVRRLGSRQPGCEHPAAEVNVVSCKERKIPSPFHSVPQGRAAVVEETVDGHLAAPMILR